MCTLRSQRLGANGLRWLYKLVLTILCFNCWTACTVKETDAHWATFANFSDNLNVHLVWLHHVNSLHKLKSIFQGKEPNKKSSSSTKKSASTSHGNRAVLSQRRSHSSNLQQGIDNVHSFNSDPHLEENYSSESHFHVFPTPSPPLRMDSNSSDALWDFKGSIALYNEQIVNRRELYANLDGKFDCTSLYSDHIDPLFDSVASLRKTETRFVVAPPGAAGRTKWNSGSSGNTDK